MRELFLLLVCLAVSASACDDGGPEPVPPGLPPPDGAWALADCPTQSGEAFLFIGLNSIACHHNGQISVDGLDSLLFAAGGDVYFNNDGDDKLLVFSDFSFNKAAYRLHLPSGDVARLSAPRVEDSQINEMAPGRFLITDVTPPPPGRADVTLTYSVYQDRQTRPLGEITLEDVGDLVAIRADVDVPSNTIVHAFLSQTLQDYLVVVVDLGSMTKRVVRLDKAFLPSSVQMLGDGTILVYDNVDGEVYRLEQDRFVPVARTGRWHDDATARRLLPYDDDHVVTFTTDGTSTRILTIDATGAVETLATVDQPTRYIGTDGQSVCGTEFLIYSPRDTVGGPTYQERVFRRAPDGTVLRQTATLSREQFVFPFVACF